MTLLRQGGPLVKPRSDVSKDAGLFTGRGGGGGKGGKGSGGAGGTPKEDPNTLRSRALARVIDLLSEGEIGTIDAKGIYLDGTALQNADGTYNFNGMTWQFRAGLPDQAPFEGFAEIEGEVPVGVEVKQNTSVTRTVSNPDVNAVQIGRAHV